MAVMMLGATYPFSQLLILDRLVVSPLPPSLSLCAKHELFYLGSSIFLPGQSAKSCCVVGQLLKTLETPAYRGVAEPHTVAPFALRQDTACWSFWGLRTSTAKVAPSHHPAVIQEGSREETHRNAAEA